MATAAEEPGTLSSMVPAPAPHDRPVTWNAIQRALVTYRRSVEVYRQLLETRTRMRLERHARFTAATAPRSVRNADASAGSATTSLELLTPRELEVARLMARGYTNQQIANILVVTRGTAANHVAHILAKLGAANRTQVAARVMGSTATGERDGFDSTGTGS